VIEGPRRGRRPPGNWAQPMGTWSGPSPAHQADGSFCLKRLAALGVGFGFASESLLYLTAINWFGRGRHMASGFIDAPWVDAR
jgi:hypothetical protein